ncbi:MAG: hypothetical protein XE13_0257 [Proteiniphilum sp. 51_7]|nr:MAG: hypothetical protein XE13_0257 [Proteiniphilum sp. 51_7]
MKKKRILFLLCSIWLISFVNAQDTTLVESDTITDNAILFPESMTGELSNLLRDWQIDLTVNDEECSRGTNVLFPDSAYISRLHRMPTVMELSFNSVVKRYIEMYASRRREQVSYMLALGDYYFPLFEQALDREGLPLELKYLPVIESALNPVAVSRAGATGLWQFMLRTGKGYGLEVNSLVDERRDPYKATEAAVRYLKDLYTIYQDWNLVIAAYNCGPGNVNKAIARSGGKRDYWGIYYHLPRETRGYVPAFIAANYIMQYYADHNICPAYVHASVSALDTVQVNERMHLSQISAVLEISVEELRRLNPQFRKDVIPGNFKPYALVLPSEKMYAFVDREGEILAYNRNIYHPHRTNTENYLNGGMVSGDAGGENIYYRVKRGDNLSTIARRNGISLAQLKSWNGLKSDRIGIGKQLVVGKKPIPATSTGKEQQTAQLSENGDVEIINQYYRVRKGDTLGKIAQQHGVRVSQLQAWNSLRSTRIQIGDRLIVQQDAVQRPKEEPAEQEYKRAEDTPRGSNIIATYLKEQVERAERQGNQELTEASSNDEAPATEGSAPDPEDGCRTEAQPGENE